MGSVFFEKEPNQNTPNKVRRGLMLQNDVRGLIAKHNMSSILHPALNVAVFGGGDAYGAHLDDRFTQAYPYILSANVDNYAHFK